MRRSASRQAALTGVVALVLAAGHAAAQLRPAPARRPNEGSGPHQRLVIRNAMVIDGAGAPPRGPVNIVIEGNRIVSVGGAGQNATHEIDARGHYVMPGFIDLHVHGGGAPKNPDVEYAYKLWLAHGVTTVRGVPLGPFDFSLSEQRRSARNEIVAPRIVNYQRPGSGWTRGSVDTPEQAREWVRWAAEQGIDGLKLGAHDPEIMAALLDEAKKHGLGSTAHLAQTDVERMNALDAARLGLGAMTHFYGLFEALLKDYTIQPWPAHHNHNDEQDRFGQVARLWDQIHPPGSEAWNELIHEFKSLDFIIDPTMTISAAADLVIVDQNPLENLKVLYGTGAIRLNDQTGQAERIGGIRYTIKDGIIYDAKQLLADVAAMVERQKRERLATQPQPAR